MIRFSLPGAVVAAAIGVLATAGLSAPVGDFAVTSSRAEVAARPAGPAVVTTRAFIDARRSLTGADRPGADLVRTSTEPLPGGGTAVRYQQRVGGIPVLGAQTVVSTDARGRVTGATGERLTGPTPDLRATVSGGQAQAIARQAVAREQSITAWGLTATPAQAVVFDPAIIGAPAPFGAHRAWSVDVVHGASGVEYRAVVNAADGGVRLIPLTHAALQRRVCDAANLDQYLPCVAANAARDEGDPASAVADVNAAYDYAGDTYDFFLNVLGRDGVDGLGSPIVSTVRYCTSTDPCPYRNAFWSSTQDQMAYGSGMVGDDVAAHEITHGITNATADLFYNYQSGAINESMSDIFGEFVDLVNNAGTDTAGMRWKMGEDIVLGVIRDMADPTAYGDPDSTQSPLWSAYVPTSPNWDYGGVHSNSGVGNKAAQLMVDGGTHRGQVVSGIGIEKAAKVFYRALTAGLTSGSNYSDLDAALQQSCTDLIGTGGITASDCLQVQRARLAVSMADAPALAPTPRAAVCTTGTRSSLFYDDIESGGGNWGTSDGTIGIITSGYAASGRYGLYLRDPASQVDANIALARTDVVVPANSYLRFDHVYLFDAGYAPTVLRDGGVVEVRARSGGTWGAWTDAGALIDSGGQYAGPLAAGNALAGRQAFGGTSMGYGSTRIDLSAYAGMAVQVRFRVATDGAVGNTGWVIDNVDIYSCATASAPPATPPAPPAPAPPAPAPPAPALAVPTVPAGGGTGAGAASAVAAPCAGLSGVPRARCTSARARASAQARAAAARTRALAACARRPVAGRARCRTVARASYARAVARARATANRSVALAKCATRPRATRATCRRAATTAYRAAIARASKARARA